MQKKFLTEVELSCEKYKGKSLTNLIKLLFHGSKNTNPKDIYESNQGLDMRYSSQGFYGQGIYFADTPNYSDGYAHVCNEIYNSDYKMKKMFLCFVLVGDACEMIQHDTSLR